MNPRIAKLPTYKNIPIVFFASIDKHGIPDFKITDEEKRMRCAKEKLCWICGELLTPPWICFVGGPASCKSGIFSDGPLHDECARDSMELCPWLLGRMDYAPTASFRTDRHEKEIRFTGDVLKAEGMDVGEPGRQHKAPDRIGIYRTFGYEIVLLKIREDFGSWFFKAFAGNIEWRDRLQRKP